MCGRSPRWNNQFFKAKSARDVRERFAWKVISSQHIEYYDEVIRKHGELPKWKSKPPRFGTLPVAGTVFVSDR